MSSGDINTLFIKQGYDNKNAHMLAFEVLIEQAIRLQKMCLDLLTPPSNYKRLHLRCQTPDRKMKLNLALASRLSREG